MWHENLYDEMCTNFIKPLFEVIQLFKYEQLHDWIRWSIDPLRAGKNEDPEPMSDAR
jgi:hypothetical protein